MTTQLASLRTEVLRDHYGRPLIEPIGGGKPEPYTRASNLPKVLGDKEALMKWMQRQVAIGMSKRPDLVDLAAACGDDKKQMSQVVRSAMEVAASGKAANIGTTLHKLTEFLDRGELPESIPDVAWPDLTAYEKAMEGIEILGCEMFVVVDEVKAAGTFDRLVRLPDGRILVADLKTGQHEPDYPHSATIQVATYSRGHLYEPGKGRIGHLPALGVDQDHGLLVHLPAGTGSCQLYLLDLQVGWEFAKTAFAVKSFFRDKPISAYSPKK